MADPLLNSATGGYLGTTGTCAPCSSGAASGCGTGYRDVTYPGDPDMGNSVLTAIAGFNGINLNWIYPGVGTDHTRVFKHTTSSFASAAQIGTAGGTYYFDALTPEDNRRYYYWIQFVSINGTQGPIIGPASAVMLPTVDQLQDMLQDRISNSLLAQELRTRIDTITDLSSAITDEIQERKFGETILTDLYATLQGRLDENGGLIYTESSVRANEDRSLAARIDGMIVKYDDSIAAIQTEQVVFANAQGALATSVETLQAEYQGMSSSIQTLQEVVAGDNGLTALYTVKLDVNGYIAGFGLYNDGNTSDFIIHADTFAIGFPGGATQGQPLYPFIVTTVNGEPVVSLDATTFIRDGVLKTAMIEDVIQSRGYGPESAGWRLNQNGEFTVRGVNGEVLLDVQPGGVSGSLTEDQQILWEDIQGDKPPQDADRTADEQFSPVIGWHFGGDTQGWTASNANLFTSQRLDFVRITATARDPIFASPKFMIRGGQAPIVRAKVTRRFNAVGGAYEEEFRLFWKVKGQSTFTNTNGFTAVDNRPTANGVSTIIEWDLSAVSNWTYSQIEQIRLDFYNNSNAVVDVDWVACGNFGSFPFQVTPENASVFIKDAAISSAHIGTLTVDDLSGDVNSITAFKETVGQSRTIGPALREITRVLVPRNPTGKKHIPAISMSFSARYATDTANVIVRREISGLGSAEIARSRHRTASGGQSWQTIPVNASLNFKTDLDCWFIIEVYMTNGDDNGTTNQSRTSSVVWSGLAMGLV